MYSKDHEWVKMDGDTATVGITDFAQARRRRRPPGSLPAPFCQPGSTHGWCLVGAGGAG